MTTLLALVALAAPAHAHAPLGMAWGEAPVPQPSGVDNQGRRVVADELPTEGYACRRARDTSPLTQLPSTTHLTRCYLDGGLVEVRIGLRDGALPTYSQVLFRRYGRADTTAVGTTWEADGTVITLTEDNLIYTQDSARRRMLDAMADVL